MAADVIARLRRELGPDRVLTDADLLAPYETDCTGRFTGRARAVARPRSVDEVAAVIAACREDGVALVPQGGNTGLVGGGVPRGGEVVLATAALAAPPAVDPVAGQVTVGAGRTLGEVQRAAAAQGWRYPIDLGARDTATIGGTVATNAGGNHVLAHGMTRRHLLGIEAVFGTGAAVSHLGGLLKDNTGYDLATLLCGSEGTLGVITELRLALVPPPEETAVALVGLDDLAAAVAVTAEARRHLPDLEAAEVVLADGVALVRDHFSLAPVLDPEPPVTLLLEAAGPIGVGDRLARHLAGVAGVRSSALATDAARRSALWRVREEHNPAINRVGPPHKYDVTLPPDVLDEVVAEIRARVATLATDAHLWVFGHVGDGNLHLNVTGLAIDADRVDEAVLTLVATAGGSISAEHGIGVAKRRWLSLARSETEIATFRTLKAALDPDAVLNPGVLL
ncbi:MAG TPA: FAD-binding oxidoreductase [Acidimicrobiales bacterium]